jgi:hypothetical protein
VVEHLVVHLGVVAGAAASGMVDWCYCEPAALATRVVLVLTGAVPESAPGLMVEIVLVIGPELDPFVRSHSVVRVGDWCLARSMPHGTPG